MRSTNLICHWQFVIFFAVAFVGSLYPIHGLAESASAFERLPEWEIPCEDRALSVGAWTPPERSWLAREIIFGGRNLNYPALVTVLDLLETLRGRVAAISAQVQESGTSAPPSFYSEALAREISLGEVDAAIERAKAFGDLLRVTQHIRRWLAFELVRPQVNDLRLDDSGQSLVVPVAGQPGGRLLEYLAQKFNLSGIELPLPGQEQTEAPVSAFSLAAFPGSSSIAIAMDEILTDATITKAIEAAFRNRQFYSAGAVPFLVSNAANLSEAILYLQEAGWVSADLPRFNYRVLTDPISGNDFWLDRTVSLDVALHYPQRALMAQRLRDNLPVNIMRQGTAANIDTFRLLLEPPSGRPQ